MIVDTESEAMKWILARFLKDSLDFLDDPISEGVVRKHWIQYWKDNRLTDEKIKQWMPEDDM